MSSGGPFRPAFGTGATGSISNGGSARKNLTQFPGCRSLHIVNSHLSADILFFVVGSGINPGNIGWATNAGVGLVPGSAIIVERRSEDDTVLLSCPTGAGVVTYFVTEGEGGGTPFRPAYGSGFRDNSASNFTAFRVASGYRSVRVVNEPTSTAAASFSIGTYSRFVDPLKGVCIVPGSSIVIEKPLDDDYLRAVPVGAGLIRLNFIAGEGGYPWGGGKE